MGNTAVMTKNDPAKIVSRSTIVPAPAQAIFDLLADPRRHQEIDGSGSIQSAQLDAPERLTLNATFGMKMKIGLPYKITNTVVEFAEGTQIAWRHFGGHVSLNERAATLRGASTFHDLFGRGTVRRQ
jgi:hypothetical protein